MKPLKLNLGCGKDQIPDFINIDGDPQVYPDKCQLIHPGVLTQDWDPNSIDEILAQDFLEHFRHFEAKALLSNFHTILKPGGKLTVRMPDAKAILQAVQCPLDKKLELLFGGQDIPVDNDPDKNQSRQLHPEFFCHGYGWTPEKFHVELVIHRFSPQHLSRHWPNFTSTSTKNQTR